MMVRTSLGMFEGCAMAMGSLLPGAESRLPWQELGNKLQAFRHFQDAESVLGGTARGEESLCAGLTRLAAVEPYRALWLKEGMGFAYAEAARCGERGGRLLAALGDEPRAAGSLIPLHAGMGLSFARRILRTVGPGCSDHELEQALEDFLGLCLSNSVAGYEGVAIEALGLPARTLYPELIRRIDRLFSELGTELRAYFWHGVGRGLYFIPSHAVPYFDLFFESAAEAALAAPHEVGRLNAVAGLSWALTLVNLTHPVVVSSFRWRYAKVLSASHAFSNGVSSAILIWCENAGFDSHAVALCEHRPAGRLEKVWQREVTEPGRRAREHAYLGRLKAQKRVGELFRYQNDADLAAGLCGESAR